MEKHIIIIRLKDEQRVENVINGVSGLGDNFQVERLHSLETKVANQVQELGLEGTLSTEQTEEFENQILSDLPEVQRRIYQTYKFEFASNAEADAFFIELSGSDSVEYIEKDELNQIYTVAPTSNDPLFEELYGHKLIEVSDVWTKTQGEGIIVAVVDSGVDYTHPDIRANMWTNAQNEFGYNFVDNNAEPLDVLGHGTHVAGTVAAIGNNSVGIVGVAPKAKLMAIKSLNDQGRGFASNLAKGVIYAADNGAHVINNSWGPGQSRVINDAIDYAHSMGCILVFAAGNSNAEVNRDMAAGNENVITVAATNRSDEKTDFSNYGDPITVSAPGLQILSLLPNSNEYTRKSGTSMACPHVAAVVALMLSAKPNLNFIEVKELLQNNTDKHFTSASAYIGTGRINAKKVFAQFNSARLDTNKIIAYSAEINIPKKVYILRLDLSDGDTLEFKPKSITDLKCALDLLKDGKSSLNNQQSIVWTPS